MRKAREIRQHRQVRQTRQLRQEQDKETKCKFKFALLDFPPYIMNQSINRGFMYQTLTWFVDTACFGREATNPIPCKMVPVFVQNQDEMVKLIKNSIGCKKKWPILACIILLSGISGVIIWLLARVQAFHRQSILS